MNYWRRRHQYRRYRDNCSWRLLRKYRRRRGWYKDTYEDDDEDIDVDEEDDDENVNDDENENQDE